MKYSYVYITNSDNVIFVQYKRKKLKLNCKQAVLIKNTLICKLVTVFIRISAPGAYFIFGLFGWAIIRGGRLLNFYHFQPYIFSKFFSRQQNNEENFIRKYQDFLREKGAGSFSRLGAY